MRQLKASLINTLLLLSNSFGATDHLARGESGDEAEGLRYMKANVLNFSSDLSANILSFLDIQNLQRLGVTSQTISSAKMARVSTQLESMISSEVLTPSQRTALGFLNCPETYKDSLELRLAFVLNKLYEWHKFSFAKRNELEEVLIRPRLMYMADAAIIPQGVSYCLLVLSLNSELQELTAVLDQVLQLNKFELAPLFVERIVAVGGDDTEKLKVIAEIFISNSQRFNAAECAEVINMLGRVCKNPKKVAKQLYDIAANALEREMEAPDAEGRMIAIKACHLLAMHPAATYSQLKRLADSLVILEAIQEATNIIIQLANRPNIPSFYLDTLADTLISLGAREQAIGLLVKRGRVLTTTAELESLAERLIGLDAIDEAIKILYKSTKSVGYVDHKKIAARLFEIGGQQTALDVLIEYAAKRLRNRETCLISDICEVADKIRDYGYKEKALEILTQLFDQREALNVSIYELVILGNSLLKNGEKNKAVKVAEEAYFQYENSDSSLPNKGYSRPRPFINLGYLFYCLGEDLGIAERYHEQSKAAYLIALKIMEDRYVSSSTVCEYEELAEGLEELGEVALKKEAIKLYGNLMHAYSNKEEWAKKQIERLASDISRVGD